MVTSVKSRVSYGMCVREPYEANVHLEEDLVFDEENWEWMADNQMNWLLQRVSCVLHIDTFHYCHTQADKS